MLAFFTAEAVILGPHFRLQFCPFFPITWPKFICSYGNYIHEKARALPELGKVTRSQMKVIFVAAVGLKLIAL